MKNKFRLRIISGISLVLFCLIPVSAQAQAQIGVGIMPGVIRVDKPVFPGGKYQLSSLQVVNTGSKTNQYELVVVKMAKQIELQSPSHFISYTPKSFTLEPGASQVISLTLDIPINATPGN